MNTLLRLIYTNLIKTNKNTQIQSEVPVLLKKILKKILPSSSKSILSGLMSLSKIKRIKFNLYVFVCVESINLK